MMQEVWIQSFNLQRYLNPNFREGADQKATGYFGASFSSFLLEPFHTLKNKHFYVKWSNYLYKDLGFLIF